MANINFTIGQSVMFEQSDRCYLGEVHFINKPRTRIDLKNVRIYPTNSELQGIQRFYITELKSIRPFNSPKSPCLSESSNSIISNEKTIQLTNGSCSVPASSSTNNATTKTSLESPLLNLNDDISNESNPSTSLSLTDLEEINNSIINLKYFHHTDCEYHEAMDRLSQQDFIGLNMEFKYCGSHSKVSIISISIDNQKQKQIYLFDIISMGTFPIRLRTILENQRPRKILHNSNILAYMLKFHNVQLSSVFDTLVAHIGLGNEKKSISLQECICFHLNLPIGIFQNEKNDDLIDFSQRPLTNSAKRIAARNSAYLLSLFNQLLHGQMLNSFYDKCNEFSNIHRKSEDFAEVAIELCCNNNNSSIEIIDDNLSTDLNWSGCDLSTLTTNSNGDCSS